jgi:hypothetical protein
MIIEKLLLIQRVYYNYVLAGKDKKTPVMRLGATNKPVKESDILYCLGSHQKMEKIVR